MIFEIEKARQVIAAAAGRTALSEDHAKTVLTCFGISVPRRVVLPFGSPIGNTLTQMTGPFALKVVAPTILHKSDVGGVALDIADAPGAQAAIDRMTARISGHVIEGWLIEEMIAPGVEIVVGATVDARFGPNVMVGIGGVFVELFEDVCFGICPIRPRDARRMLDSLRGARMLRGWRGAPAIDEALLVDVLLRVGGEDGLIVSLSDAISEIDINPLVVSARGAAAADARIVLRGGHG